LLLGVSPRGMGEHIKLKKVTIFRFEYWIRYNRLTNSIKKLNILVLGLCTIQQKIISTQVVRSKTGIKNLFQEQFLPYLALESVTVMDNVRYPSAVLEKPSSTSGRNLYYTLAVLQK
jgi:hypothetical protein